MLNDFYNSGFFGTLRGFTWLHVVWLYTVTVTVTVTVVDDVPGFLIEVFIYFSFILFF